MNAITKNIPNSITCLNLLSGCFACLFAYKGEYDIVALCIGLSALFDFLDGMAARLLHAYSPMGKELDSLADLISFGLAPGFMAHAFHAIRQCLSWNKRFLSDLVGIKRIAYSRFLRTPFSEIQYRYSSDNLVHRIARSCQRSFLDRNMSSRLTNRGQSLWIRYRLLSHSLLFPIDFGDSHVFFKIQELEVKRKLSSLFDFNRCRNFPYLFRTGRPRRNNRLVYNIIAVDSQEALTTKTERFLF